ncbi:serine/threonine protein kinase [Nostoc sp. CENA67]|uniref:non-specific serine/threonine protein kinase n=1 Tax=Amazonocrinis nigriterrae CENA67 TaxID=2794033 RepID=A0A8J7L8U4_9NOST|nr:serine/threonine-protein kinase [Amazonocrinis nigriterrae]MBH8563560.1 serine/threonine protein kinase [Amazonocrinis nigriterrae CENA67]
MSLCINPVCLKPNNPDNHQNRFCQNCGSPLELLGRYRVMHLLSDKTDFGKVYEVYEQDTPKILKVLAHNLSNDAKAVKMFRQEADVLKKLHHPGIPKIDDYFQHQTRNNLVLHCIVMEKIDGLNLEQWLKQQQNHFISQEQAITWLKQLAEILDLVHGKLYLHGNIQPSNIMIRRDRQLVLIDFGTINELTRTYLSQLSKDSGNITKMIPSSYSAPEQINAIAVPQSDFFALGHTFVFLLTGHHPLDMYDVHQNVWQWQGHATHISPLLLNLIDWLMMPEVENRPTNAQEILQRLEEIEQQHTRINALGIYQPEQLAQPKQNILSSSPHKQPEKLALPALFAALLVSLGLLNVIGLVTGYPKLTAFPNNGQHPQRKGKIDYFPYAEGRDSQGRIAEFNIAVLSIEYKWLYGSNFQIKYNDQVISIEVLKLNLQQEGIQQIMENPNEIISVGTATCEGNVGVGQRIALERSKQVQFLAKKLFNNTPSVKNYRLLNLGQFLRNNCQKNQDLTAYQRSVIIMGVKKKSAGVILDEALRDRLDKKPFGDFKLKDYSLGSVDKFKTISSNL